MPKILTIRPYLSAYSKHPKIRMVNQFSNPFFSLFTYQIFFSFLITTFNNRKVHNIPFPLKEPYP